MSVLWGNDAEPQVQCWSTMDLCRLLPKISDFAEICECYRFDHTCTYAWFFLFRRPAGFVAFSSDGPNVPPSLFHLLFPSFASLASPPRAIPTQNSRIGQIRHNFVPKMKPGQRGRLRGGDGTGAGTDGTFSRESRCCGTTAAPQLAERVHPNQRLPAPSSAETAARFFAPP
jgi:hypothetical protein